MVTCIINPFVTEGICISTDDNSREINQISEELMRIVAALSDLTQTSFPPIGNHNDTLIKVGVA